MFWKFGLSMLAHGIVNGCKDMLFFATYQPCSFQSRWAVDVGLAVSTLFQIADCLTTTKHLPQISSATPTLYEVVVKVALANRKDFGQLLSNRARVWCGVSVWLSLSGDVGLGRKTKLYNPNAGEC